jgi:hypothetical protein
MADAGRSAMKTQKMTMQMTAIRSDCQLFSPASPMREHAGNSKDGASDGRADAP